MRLRITLLLLPALSACAVQMAPASNTDFSPTSAAEIVRGFARRDRYNLPKPTGDATIYVDSVAVHHLHTEASTIVWRDRAGKWQWTQAKETGLGGLLPVEPKLESHETRTLTQAEGRALGRLIRNPKLYSGRVVRTGKIGLGAPLHVMVIVTPFGRTTVKWDGRLRGPSGRVADIVLGHE
jgi:hypothetical protein